MSKAYKHIRVHTKDFSVIKCECFCFFFWSISIEVGKRNHEEPFDILFSVVFRVKWNIFFGFRLLWKKINIIIEIFSWFSASRVGRLVRCQKLFGTFIEFKKQIVEKTKLRTKYQNTVDRLEDLTGQKIDNRSSWTPVNSNWFRLKQWWQDTKIDRL